MTAPVTPKPVPAGHTSRPGAGTRALRSPLAVAGFLRRVAATPSGAFGLIVVCGMVVVAAFAPLIAPHDYATIAVPRRLEGPSAAHWLGTDHLGRDLLSRLIGGTRVALQISIPAVAIGLVIGLVVGLLAGFVGRWVDTAAVMVMDAIQSFPAVILALAVLALADASKRNIVLVIALAFVPGFARVTRASVQVVKQNPYVDAERSLGAGTARIILVHVLPNIAAPLLVLTAMNLPSAVAVESGLAFLGLGVQPPTPDWGVILSEGFDRIRQSPWPVLWTCGTLGVVTLGFTFLGERLRDVLDVRTGDRQGDAS